MEKYYEERFKAQRRLAEKIAPLMEINDILEKIRDELREMISFAMEARILLLDPDAKKYTRPLELSFLQKEPSGHSKGHGKEKGGGSSSRRSN